MCSDKPNTHLHVFYVVAARANENAAARREKNGPDTGWWTTQIHDAKTARLRAWNCWSAAGLGF